MKQNPFFSVIICTYNRATLITRALDSLLLQTCTDWEAIIVDDASTDNTTEVIRPYLSTKIRCKKHGKQLGCARSKNTGIKASKGAYITFLDSDDEYKPDHLSIRKTFLENNPKTDLLHSDTEVIGNAFVPDKNDKHRLIPINECIIGGTFVIRKETMTPSDFFTDTYSDDSIFMERYTTSGRTVKKINSPTYIYHRDVADSMCNIVANRV